ncbi:sensor histidine kinase [Gorillibacterium sp. sgz5001074]|uniref:sensor histidine kinase n=1 Tax=Gorillibacterium sp. sgz5001074 TaxID=3446695 RepID=UPI003F67BF59
MKIRWKPTGIVNDIPLKYKFILINLLCVLPLMFINALFYVQNSRSTESRERENLQISLERAAYELSQMVDVCVTIGSTVSADRTFNERIETVYPDYSTYYDMYDGYLRDKLRQYPNMYPYISWIGVYTTNSSIENGGDYFILKDSDKDSEWYKKIQSNKEKVLVTSYLDINPMNPEQKMVYVSIIRKLDTFPDLMAHTKYLRVDLKLNKLQELFHQERNYLRFILLDEQKRIVLDSRQSYFNEDNLLSTPPSGTEADHYGMGSAFVSHLKGASYMSDWQLIGIPATNRIEQERRSVLRFTIALTLMSTVVPSVLIYIILHSYNLRVRRLSKHMQLVKNERFERVEMYEGKDEIGGLIRTFNLMTEKIRNLIHDVYKLDLQKKDLELEQVRAELNYLQSQVDPHFLFNTLNAILIVCKKHKYEHVMDIIRNLSLILRRLLGRKDDFISIEEELSFVEMYLQIEKFRFQDRFHYEMDIDPRVLSCRIPKMCIQSLVENSCKHGLQMVKGERKIRIAIGMDDRSLVMQVEDNGIGMDSDKLKWIQEHLHADEETGKNIGLRNVYKRLNLYYKDRSYFTIDSKEKECTRVTIRIPLTLLFPQEELEANV